MKYGPDMTKEIAEKLRLGSSRTDACILAGISYETFTVWMEKPEFSEAIKRAEAECKNRNIGIIQKAAITTWQAAAWWLERKHHTEFAQKNQLEVTSNDQNRPTTETLVNTLRVLREELDSSRKGTRMAKRK